MILKQLLLCSSSWGSGLWKGVAGQVPVTEVRYWLVLQASDWAPKMLTHVAAGGDSGLGALMGSLSTHTVSPVWWSLTPCLAPPRDSILREPGGSCRACSHPPWESQGGTAPKFSWAAGSKNPAWVEGREGSHNLCRESIKEQCHAETTLKYIFTWSRARSVEKGTDIQGRLWGRYWVRCFRHLSLWLLKQESQPPYNSQELEAEGDEGAAHQWPSVADSDAKATASWCPPFWTSWCPWECSKERQHVEKWIRILWLKPLCSLVLFKLYCVCVYHLGILLKYRFWFSRSGMSLRFCI